MRHLAAAAAGAAMIAATSACAAAQETPPSERVGELSLSAEGEISAAPDMATLIAGVVAEAATAEEAMADQRDRMSAVVEAVKAAGIADADIQTSGFDLSPVYAPYEKGQNEPRITGYRASNRVTAVVRDLAAVGPTLDALVASGANTIDGVQFGIEDSDTLLDEARREAVRKLMSKADLYADAGGFDLGRILNMSESGGWNQPPQPQFYARAALAEASSTPIEGGQLKLTVTVSATFAIDD
jgi:uncharacterized protein YggE